MKSQNILSKILGSIQVAWIGLISFMQPIFFAIGISEAVLGYILMKRY